MTKAECFTMGCPFIIKKRDKITLMPYYVCGKKGVDVKQVHNCEEKKVSR